MSMGGINTPPINYSAYIIYLGAGGSCEQVIVG